MYLDSYSFAYYCTRMSLQNTSGTLSVLLMMQKTEEGRAFMHPNISYAYKIDNKFKTNAGSLVFVPHFENDCCRVLTFKVHNNDILCTAL